jgi:hypothetical protein
MGLIGSGMCLSDVTCPQPPAEHPISRITRTAVLLSLVRAPALPPRHAYFGSQSHTPYDRCLRFGPRVAATPARLAPVPLAQLWTDQTCTGKLIPASPIAPRIRLSDWFHRGHMAGGRHERQSVVPLRLGCAIQLPRKGPTLFRAFRGSSPITLVSPSSKAHQKSGSFPPPALPGFSGTMTLSDPHLCRRL